VARENDAGAVLPPSGSSAYKGKRFTGPSRQNQQDSSAVEKTRIINLDCANALSTHHFIAPPRLASTRTTPFGALFVAPRLLLQRQHVSFR